jgi:hypothetical protein
MSAFPHRKAPCAECPWRKDVPVGKFPPERYRALAQSAEDASFVIFSCHLSKETKPVACAGWLLQASAHSLAVRLAIISSRLDLDAVTDGGHSLFSGYRALAQANGVRPGDPSLQRCRDDGAWKR